MSATRFAIEAMERTVVGGFTAVVEALDNVAKELRLLRELRAEEAGKFITADEHDDALAAAMLEAEEYMRHGVGRVGRSVVTDVGSVDTVEKLDGSGQRLAWFVCAHCDGTTRPVNGDLPDSCKHCGAEIPEVYYYDAIKCFYLRGSDVTFDPVTP